MNNLCSFSLLFWFAWHNIITWFDHSPLQYFQSNSISITQTKNHAIVINRQSASQSVYLMSQSSSCHSAIDTQVKTKITKRKKQEGNIKQAKTTTKEEKKAQRIIQLKKLVLKCGVTKKW